LAHQYIHLVPLEWPHGCSFFCDKQGFSLSQISPITTLETVIIHQVLIQGGTTEKETRELRDFKANFARLWATLSDFAPSTPSESGKPHGLP
jgi:hypothetical protein